ncbi:SAM-dependent methyltransferase [Thermomonospora umbrina]|uniref:O-methyltransferase involved in polyketide biosynthesis n=1 Tax=Thermomonospora umbrina TaxID=111806 RepID=A0A3D9SSW2_9ACTN|nr:SAM-dependent methyltransferase [Thermomonospora umbrina]REE98697.1 O-methyltransferase involved in polyketide biosynthesis [Thermomonospora umbrina]
MRSHGVDRAESGIDRPHSARTWNYWLGGKDYYPADKNAADLVEDIIPGIVDSARADRAFLERCIRHLVVDQGIRQFLDVGAGLPTADNTHQVAQRLAPEARIVYVDNDPLVVAHARSLLCGAPRGAISYVEGDLRRPEDILKLASETLDLTRPIAVMLLSTLNHVLDDEEAHRSVHHLLDAVPSGSFLAIAHPTAEVDGDAMHEAIRRYMEHGGTPLVARDRAHLARYFEDLELLEPGVVSCTRWRPDSTPREGIPEVSQFCAVGRKP